MMVMRRWALRIFVFMLLGAIVNVAVAWVLTWWPITFAGVPLTNWAWHREDGSTWRAFALTRWPEPEVVTRHPLGAEYWEAPGAVLCAYNSSDTETDGPTARSTIMEVTWEDRGWPACSLRAIEWRESSLDQPTGEVVKQSYIWFERRFDDARAEGWLPLHPIWPGFAINTLFYAAVLWVLFSAPFALRKWRRIRRGLCPKCGYDLRNRPSDSAVCPECGATR
jgi:hypothetical protein